MRRWNGWGDDSVETPLPDLASRHLLRSCGPGAVVPDAELADVLAGVPAPEAPSHPLLRTDPEVRVRAARGHSLPDWVALRSGQLGRVPDAVAFAPDDEAVRDLLALAARHDLAVVPRGGGTSVVGHLTPTGERPTIVLDTSAMAALEHLDGVDGLATFGAGVTGPAIEDALRPHGMTLGHYPQSWEYSTLGGWVATRSSGQESRQYGRIEQLFAGGHVETPQGPLEVRPLPASAAGPDLRHLVLGSEGRLGVITRATVRVVPVPPVARYTGVLFADWASAVAAARAITQEGLRVSMVRVSDPVETSTTLRLVGGAPLALASRALVLPRRRAGAAPCLLVVGVVGTRRRVRAEAAGVRRVVLRHGGLPLGSPLGAGWRRGRFHGPYLRNGLWDAGYVVDTAETALPWSRLEAARLELVAAVAGALRERGVRPLVYTHISHVYPDGASLYLTAIWPRRRDPAELLADWSAMKGAVSTAVVHAGGTISHQHGVGLDHAPYLAAEKSELGLGLLAATMDAADPQRVMNPGKLLPSPPGRAGPGG